MNTLAIPAAATRFYTALRAADVEAVVAGFAADAVCNDPVGSPAVTGHDGLRQFFSGLFSAFARFDGLVEDEVYVSGDGVAVRWTARGLTKAGLPLQFSGIDVLRIGAAGLITRLDAYYDSATVFAALGA